jgi:hypothetical protein
VVIAGEGNTSFPKFPSRCGVHLRVGAITFRCVAYLTR